ncbi:hypothetical protein B566_EDAN015647 [Ephemera danica]|nr:hypothetical protein B566_EDAN015647 [Ephemera danica]
MTCYILPMIGFFVAFAWSDLKNKSFRPRERGKKGLKNLETVKTLAGRTQSYGNNQMKGVGSRKQPLTVTAQFQQSLHSLMITLNQANPYFIRCIKSNGNKVPNEFDADTVQRQLRYTGMLETVRIRQAGYNVRLTYDEFIQLYRILLPKGLVSSQSDVRDFLLTLNLNRDNYQIGHTKVFLRESEKVKLDYRLHQQIIASIVAIQRWFRASLERKRFILLKNIVINLQSHCRAYLVRQRVNHLRLMNSAARYIQRVWRGHRTRCWYLKLLAGVHVVQARARGMLARRKFQALLAQHHQEQAQQLKLQVTKVANKSIVHLSAGDSYVLRGANLESAQRKRDAQTFDDSVSRQLENLPPLDAEVPKRRLVPAKIKTIQIDGKQDFIDDTDSQQAGAGVPINMMSSRKGSSESLTSLKSTDSVTGMAKPTLQHRAKKQIQAFIGGRKVDKLGNNNATNSDSEADESSSKQRDWKKSSLDSAPQPNKPLARSPHVLLQRFPSSDSKNQKAGDPQWPEQQEVAIRPNRHNRASREISYSVGDNEVDSQPAIRWSRASESSDFRSRADTQGSEGGSECSQLSPRESDLPKFLKMGAAAVAVHPSPATNASSSHKRQWSPQTRGQLDLKRRNSDPAKSMAAAAAAANVTHPHPDPLSTPENPKTCQDIEFKGTMFTIAGHRFRKVSRFSKEDKCVSCSKCMDAFITQGHKCTECKQLFHTKCIQNGGVQKLPCQHASGGGKPGGRRKHRKHSRTPYDMSKPQGAGKFSLTGTSEFTDSTDKIISDARELQLMQDFITNKIYKIESEEGKKPSEVDRVFKQALKEFKDNLLSTYSIVNKQGVEGFNIKYKDLIANFLQTVCYQENTREDFPVTMGVNAFRGFMNEFMAQNRLEEKPKTKRKKEKKRKTEDPISHFGHLFQLTIINIPTACEICTSFFMWPIERGLVCQRMHRAVYQF